MKRLLTVFCGEHFGFFKLALALFVGLALSFPFWAATAPVAKAGPEEISPAEMIQSNLPQNKTLATATKPEVLSAVCGAVRKWQNDAPQIVRTAAAARKEFAADIVVETIRSLRALKALDRDLVGQIVAAGLSANPEAASNIIDLAVQAAPDLREAIEAAGTPAEGPGGLADGPTNQNPPPGSIGGGAGGFDPEERNVTICDNGQNVQVPTSKEEAYLHSHPGSRLGACQVTPGVNR
jgi:hypothetical protein